VSQINVVSINKIIQGFFNSQAKHLAKL